MPKYRTERAQWQRGPGRDRESPEMTNQIRTTALRPLGRGPLHGAPTVEAARTAALRAWAQERCREGHKNAPVDAAHLLAKRTDDAPSR